jgi:hypothetical protein
MPWSRSLVLGIALLLLGACGGSAAITPSPSPTPVPTPVPTPTLDTGNAPWTLNLDFTGDLAAHVTGTALTDDLIRNECTGISSARLGSWASTMAMILGNQRYALVVLAGGYKGAGVFTSGVNVEFHSADKSTVWQNGPGDVVSFTVGGDETSGLLDATLSNAANPARKLNISGHWSCQP